MSANSKIEWTDHTFNPWEGCQKVGPGCDHCYAETRNARFGGGQAINWGPGAPRRRTSESNWNLPKRWNEQHDAFFAQHGRRQRVFCASLADVFDNAVDPQWREDLFALINATPNLDWLLLTKRIGNVPLMVSMIPGWLPANVWLGATIVNQAEADRDIPKLLAVPARLRFLSMEPLLGPVNLWRVIAAHCERHPGDLDADGKCPVCEGRGIWEIGEPLAEADKAPIRSGIDWIIVGGESGPSARPMHPDWARDLRDQCTAHNVPFLFKQHGEWVSAGEPAFGTAHAKTVALLRPDGTIADPSSEEARDEDADLATMSMVGKKAAGRLLDGREWNEVPS